MIRHSLEPGKARPIVPGCLDVPVRRRLDLLTLRAGLLEAPLALPVISTPYKRCMFRRDARDAEPACIMITGAAAPLSVKDLEGALAGYDIAIGHAKSRGLREAVIAGPALLAGTVVRIRREVANGLL